MPEILRSSSSGKALAQLTKTFSTSSLQEFASIKLDSMDVHRTIARRIRDLRNDKGWSLDTLAERSTVSRSNISLIERGQSSPTAVVLDKLATALGVH
jgi:ribosome-binding protein aMBF1 (putative translation factor)